MALEKKKIKVLKNALKSERLEKTNVEKELEIARDITRQEGKPEEMVEKIAQGKLNKFFKESTLLSQDFIKDSKKSVQQYLQAQDKDLIVLAFKRFSMS